MSAAVIAFEVLHLNRLQRAYDRARVRLVAARECDDDFYAEAATMACLMRDIQTYREFVAQACAPWFEASSQNTRAAEAPGRGRARAGVVVSSFVNHAPSTRGRVVAICECCGRRSRPTAPNHKGEPELFDIGRGWSQAPFPADFKHDDGSTGSTYTCAACNKRLAAGETLTLRNYGGEVVA